MDKQSEELNSMIEAYKNNDLKKLYQAILKNKEFKDYKELLLDKRNENWIPKIEEIIKEQSAFIAVGAGHLPSKHGVIDLLKAKGYEVTPVLY